MTHPLLLPFDAPRRQALRRRLLHWHARHGRNLPWRNVADPYRVWISEIMLQQTTVKAVIPYYERFLKRFPSVAALAAAEEGEVLRHWEGLGYYSRGRNLHRAAQVIRDQFGGEFPSSLDELLSLPGVGRYTAGAIRSFGFQLPAPIVEANTLRLYCRLLGLEDDPKASASQALLWGFADLVQPRSRAGDLNQALMDLGAEVCTPRDPACESCPLSAFCSARMTQRQNLIPLAVARPQPTQVVEVTFALRHKSRFLVQQRLPGQRWAGLWDFPRFPVSSLKFAEPFNDRRFQKFAAELQRELHDQHPELFSLIDAGDLKLVGEFHHTVTRYRIRLLCLTCELAADVSSGILAEENSRWVTLKQLAELPMPVTGRKFAGLLAKK